MTPYVCSYLSPESLSPIDLLDEAATGLLVVGKHVSSVDWYVGLAFSSTAWQSHEPESPKAVHSSSSLLKVDATVFTAGDFIAELCLRVGVVQYWKRSSPSVRYLEYKLQRVAYDVTERSSLESLCVKERPLRKNYTR